MEAAGDRRERSECVGRYLLFASVRAHLRQAHRGHPGGEEPEEDGRRRSEWSVCEDRANGERQACEEEENIDQKVHA